MPKSKKLYSIELLPLKFLIDAELGTAKTVGNYLKELEKAGFSISEKVGKEKLYLNHRLMAVLEAS